MKKITIEDLKWEGNSKIMYETIINSIPPLYKAAIKKKFEVWINKNNVDTITEWNIFHTIEKYAPENFKNKLLPIAENLKTK